MNTAVTKQWLVRFIDEGTLKERIRVKGIFDVISVDGQTMMNKEQFANLVAEQSDELYNYACYMLHSQEDAADLLQDVFLLCWQHRERIVTDLEQNWLWRVTSRRCLDMLRKRQRSRKRFKDLEPEQLSQLSDTGSGADTDFDQQQRKRQLHNALAVLPDRTRSIMIMRYFNDFDFREIAERMNMRSGAVRVIVLRARKRMHQFMTDCSTKNSAMQLPTVNETIAFSGGTTNER